MERDKIMLGLANQKSNPDEKLSIIYYYINWLLEDYVKTETINHNLLYSLIVYIKVRILIIFSKINI